jgi:23S rRNA (cytosine1962-C5)-methyltransferase
MNRPVDPATVIGDADYAESFSRNIGILTAAEQAQLARTTVAIAGLGGVGGNVLMLLARMGIGRFRIADFDRFERVNINRQPGAASDTIGQPKCDVLVVQVLAAAMETRTVPIVEALVRLLTPRGVLARNDVKVREREGLPRETKTLWGEVPDAVSIQEGSVSLSVDVINGQKTGTFLDQSGNHVMFGRLARGRVLDAFCHDGGFGLQAARNPAVKEVIAVDISAEALVRAQANAAGNALTLQTVEANVFDFLTDEVAAGSRYDTIALDPPAFAKTKGARDAAWRGYKEINRRALQLLEPGGILLTCSCSYHVSEEEFEAVVADAAADSGITAQIIERRSQSPDHPVRLGMPETRYLKALVVRKLE